MHIPKQNKLLLLLFSEQAPIWQNLLKKKTLSNEDVRAIGKVSTGTYYNWRDGEDIRTKLIERIQETTLSRLKELKADQEVCNAIEAVFEAIFDTSKEQVHATAERLGFKVGEAQRVIDTHVHDQLPLFPNLYYPARGAGSNASKQAFEAIGGAYYVWMRRGAGWLRCTLRVRYPLDVNAGKDKPKGAAIRCKLNVPIIDRRGGDRSYWEYDGFVRMRERRVFWMLEKRHLEPAGYVYLVTGDGFPEGNRLSFTGAYLTTEQDRYQSIAGGDLLMERLPIGIKDEENMEQAMANGTRVLSGDELSEPEARWRELAKRWEGPGLITSFAGPPTAPPSD